MAVEAARPDDVRRQNRGTILGAIRLHGALSRTDVSVMTGISPATVSAITTDLISEGFLRTSAGKDTPANRRGRPQVLLEHDPAAARIASVSLSVSGLAIEISDYSGNTTGQGFVQSEPPSGGASGLVEQIVKGLHQSLETSDGTGPLKHISVGVQGVTDASNSRMLWSPITAARHIPVGPALSDAFGVPVIVENDCNMIVEALRWLPDFPHRDDFAAVLLGRGIGMGLYINGRRFHGVYSSAVEFGHMSYMPHGRRCRCGAFGCIEAYAGDYAIIAAVDPEQEARTFRGDVGDTEIADLAAMARSGDPDARAAFEVAGEAIGFGLASVFSLVDPVPVAFVGRGSAALDLMEPAMRSAVESTAAGDMMTDLLIHAFPDEQPLILAGCRMTSLSYLDKTGFSRSDPSAQAMEMAG